MINIQNLGIVIAFGAFFTTALLIFTQFNTSLSTDTAVTLYKRGSKRHPRISGSADEENGPTSPTSLNEKGPASPKPGDVDIVPPMTDVFSWQHVNYTVPIPGKADRQLLSDVSGYVAPGKLTALMGESGAGKTTLLNVLAQRTNVGVVAGDRFVNGQPLPHDFQSQTYAFFTAFLSLNGLTFIRFSGYCQQMDTHVPFATVREALLFSAKLRQPASVSLAEKEAYVEKCLKMCGLEAYGEASVGSLSVEHRKRTTIAVELAARVHIPLIFQRDFYLTSTLSPNCSSSWTSPLLGWILRVPGLSCHSYAPSPITAKPFFARKFSLYLIPTSSLTFHFQNPSSR